MKARSFALRPFPGTAPLPACRLTGSVAQHRGTLALSYALHGSLAELALPAPVGPPARRHGLWQTTCFEVFFGVREAPGYWEVNLSPAGDWNVYRFAGYRQGMAEETAFSSLPFSVQTRPNSLLLDLQLDVARLVPAAQPLEVGLTAVVQCRGGGLTYWALTHPGPQANFHRRDSFVVKL